MLDRNVKFELSVEVQKALKEHISNSAELKEFHMHIENLKQEIRKELDISKRKNENDLEAVLSQRFPSGSVAEWVQEDTSGYVYGWPDKISVPTVESDDQVYLVFYGNSIDKKELASFLRIKALYDHYNPQHVAKALTVVNFMSPPVRELVNQLNFELLTPSKYES